jgi:Ubiquitin carboxyl-terminal hydrolase
LLHVYELEPAPDEAIDNTITGVSEQVDIAKPLDDSADDTKVANSDGDTTDESASGDMDAKSKHAFLAIAQRRSEVVSQSYLHPLAHRVFGTPLLLRVSDLETCHGRNLYDLIARRLRNFVPKSALRFLTVYGDSTGQDGISAAESTVSEKVQTIGRHSRHCRTTTDMEEVSAGPVPRYGFRLRTTSRDGRRCLVCPWYECCVGCLIPDDDTLTTVMDGDSIVVDWHFAVDVATSGFGLRQSPTDPIASPPTAARPRIPGATVKNHSSCGTGAKKGVQAGAITLEDCLDAFAEEERIPEAYCSKCKDFRVQTKRMSLWRLPPVIIIHLKRFQFTQHMRRKLRDLVVFPVEGLDLSRIMARDSEGQNPVPKASHNGDESVLEDDAQTKDDGRSEMLYDLYGVVHHQGALSGGHYVASLKSEIDGQWRLFNDAQIYEIHARDVVDASAYILFYIRRDVSKAQLSDYWDVREEGNLSEEDMDQLLKGRSDRCVIS